MRSDRHRRWVREAVRRIDAGFQRSSDTHLIPVALPGIAGIDRYLRDESSACGAHTAAVHRLIETGAWPDELLAGWRLAGALEG